MSRFASSLMRNLYGKDDDSDSEYVSADSCDESDTLDCAIGEDDELKIQQTHVETVKVVTPAGKAHYHCINTLPVPHLWPDRPLLCRESAVHSGHDPLSIGNPVQVNQVYEFDTDQFRGSILVRLPSTMPANAEDYFAEKRRLSSIIITGQFKHALPFAQVFTGQEFCYAIKLPGMLLVRAVIKFFRYLAPLLQVNTSEENTYLLSPIAQTVQVMHVSATPFDLKAQDVGCSIEEDTSLLGGYLAENKLDQFQRKKYFSKGKNLKKYSFNTEHYYTFDFYNDKLNLETFELTALAQSFDLVSFIQGQPLRILARVLSKQEGNKEEDNSADYLWNFEIWHEKQCEVLGSID